MIEQKKHGNIQKIKNLTNNNLTKTMNEMNNISETPSSDKKPIRPKIHYPNGYLTRIP
ncbi:MAG: hypothetical protein K9W44_14045 [Candidatus Lokiarchaeota archaeon]|nr:hypothetical protein [Candidatus Harpocratesius repetitus]